jgi:hypothetical protein
MGKQNKTLLLSMNLPDIMDPQAIFFSLAKGCYYQALLDGKKPIEPVFAIDRQFTGGHTTDISVDYHTFGSVWANPGFKFQDSWDYWVDSRKVVRLNPMNLGWDWSPLRARYPSAVEVYRDWVHKYVDLAEQSVDDVVNLMRFGQRLPERVVARLNLICESDSYIMHTLPEEWGMQEYTGIVTRDKRLCLRVAQVLNHRYPQVNHKVIALDPAIYMVGRVDDAWASLRLTVPGFGQEAPLLEDPGAMLHVDFTEFTDGFPHREDIWDAEIGVSFWHNYVLSVRI